MNFVIRSIVAVLFIPLLLWLYYTGGLTLGLFLCMLSILGSSELLKMFILKQNNTAKYPLIYFVNLFFTFGIFYSIAFESKYIFAFIIAILIYNSALDVFANQMKGSTFRIAFSLFAVLYPALGFGLIFKLSTLSQFGNTLLPILAILIWITDTFAYFSGRLFGKHKNIFACSPKKSAEGFIGGIIFAFIASMIAMKIYPEIYTIKHTVILALSAGIIGQFGDLMESVLKRDMGVKDSSNIIPGHGGVLDRFDSILIAGPVLYVIIC